jgi:hypothetical protein
LRILGFAGLVLAKADLDSTPWTKAVQTPLAWRSYRTLSGYDIIYTILNLLLESAIWPTIKQLAPELPVLLEKYCGIPNPRRLKNLQLLAP